MDVDWIGALIGAVAGAVLTALVGYGAYRIERAKVEQQALRELALSLSERRAFRIPTPQIVPGAAGLADFAQLNSSIVSAREVIRDTRSKLVHKEAAQRTLTAMIQLCNGYLEDSAAGPDQYWFLAAALRDDLHQQLEELPMKLRPVPVPGSGAFPPSRGVGGQP
ncbi:MULTISPECIES: hypothetical protein [unclassified Curtobacterium]|uniref:hypothetical protein n=1 Tax=unclassified Curtobacterium TaxID=257496 RepID=UPI003A811F27